MKKKITFALLLGISPVFTLQNTSFAAPVSGTENLEYLKSLDIADLLATEITSVSKKPEKLANAAAAAFVITAEDIERTGARNIPEALRMVPGLQVAQITASSWAISARGFTDLFSNKLLVLIDGRSVYTPLFSGVFWELQDTVIEDIDRIEVIRGPGATLWGANAVNGVINIITKSSSDTEGYLVSTGIGTSHKLMASGRIGGGFGEQNSFRLYAKGNIHDGNVKENGDDAHDSWNNLRSGFRTDMFVSEQSSLTITGDIYKGEEEVTYRFPGVLPEEMSEDTLDYKGGNILGKLETTRTNGSVYSLQAYYDYSTTDSLVPSENRHTADLDFQYKFDFGASHEIVWGLGYRLANDDINSTPILRFDPESKTDHLYSGFLQDEITLVEDTFWVTLGSKFEHNDYSGFEVQPNLRFRWKPVQNQTIWAAVSRAVRSPARADHDIDSAAAATIGPMGNRVVSKILGQDDFEAEELLAYEAGHRWSPRPNLSFDTSVFYNVYENQRSLEQGAPFLDTVAGVPAIVVPTYIGNGVDATTYGIEFLGSWNPTDQWKLYLSYSYLHVDFEGDPGVDLSRQSYEEEDSPTHQFQFRSYYDINDSWSFDTDIYFVDELSDRNIDAYLRIDCRLGFQINDELHISLNLENITEDQHAEFNNTNSLTATEVPRQVYAKLTWSY